MGSKYVRCKEIVWFDQGAIYMGFCSKIDNIINRIVLKDLFNRFLITDISFPKCKVLFQKKTSNVDPMSCIGQSIKTDKEVFRILFRPPS